MAELCAAAVAARDEALLVEALREAARQCAAAERRGDVRDGLPAMCLPFDAAGRLGLDGDTVAGRAAVALDVPERELLLTFAGRADRADLAAMGWTAQESPDGFVYRRRSPA